MRPISIKLDEETIETIDAEAEENDLTRSQYLRRIIDDRDAIEDGTPVSRESLQPLVEQAVQETVADLAVDVDDLTERLARLEATDDRPASGEAPRTTGPPRDTEPFTERSEHTPAPDSTPTKAHTPAADGASHIDEEIETLLEGWRPGQSLARREERRAAGRAAIEYLRENDVASASEFKRDVEPEHPVSEQSTDTWWRKTAKPALKRAEIKGWADYETGKGDWHWIGG